MIIEGQSSVSQNSPVQKNQSGSARNHVSGSDVLDSPDPHTTKMNSASSQGPTPLSSDRFLWEQ